MFKSLKDLMDDHPKMREPLIQDVLREGEVMNLVGMVRSAKTQMALQLALSVCTGRPWLGYETKAKRVLYVDGERHAEAVLERTKATCLAMDIQPEAVSEKLSYRLLRSNVQSHDFDDFISDIRSHDFGLVVVDPFCKLVPGYDECSNEKLSEIFEQLSNATERQRCGLVLVHHTKKGTPSVPVAHNDFGSTLFSRMADTQVTMQPNGDNNNRRLLHFSTRTFPPKHPLDIAFKWPLWRRVEDAATK